ncbi:hypothetical protein E1301_Tti012951 [Triplophysa tibetana]|uniref:Uncharacterized protein n=1 Tax=Triplophysa tibetana TaxID=1572043 RepID=A0A5A9NSJ9_9TELE|nr:hypothetical protein E1301_Tti012951 [Triplophysa tibetana]
MRSIPVLERLSSDHLTESEQPVLKGKMPFCKKHSLLARRSEVYRKQRRFEKSSTLSQTGKPTRFKNYYALSRDKS